MLRAAKCRTGNAPVTMAYQHPLRWRISVIIVIGGGGSVVLVLPRTTPPRLVHCTRYPRLIGETGGKELLLGYSSADARSAASNKLLAPFEYQG